MSNVRHVKYDPFQWDSPDVKHCVEYWREIKGDSIAPKWSDFQWDRIPTEIVPYFAVVDILGPPLSMTYRFFGTAHARAHNIDLSGRSPLDMVPADIGLSMFNQYAEVAESGEPALYFHVLGETDTALETIEISEVSLRLPFSNDGETITSVMSFSDLRENLDHAIKHFVYDKVYEIDT